MASKSSSKGGDTTTDQSTHTQTTTENYAQQATASDDSVAIGSGASVGISESTTSEITGGARLDNIQNSTVNIENLSDEFATQVLGAAAASQAATNDFTERLTGKLYDATDSLTEKLAKKSEDSMSSQLQMLITGGLGLSVIFAIVYGIKKRG